MNGYALALFATPVAAGVLAGHLAGGRAAGLVALRPRHLWLLWVAAAVQVVQLSAYSARGPLRGPLLAVVFAVGLVWLGLNMYGRPRALRVGACVAMAGGVLNAVPIALNGRMPYSPSAAVAAGLGGGVRTPKNMAATSASRLTFLGDVIPVRPYHAIISAGDILIVAGTFVLILAAMRAPVGRPAPRNHGSTSSGDTRAALDAHISHNGG